MTKEVFSLFLALIVIGFPVLGAIVLVLTSHQRKMAELLRGHPGLTDWQARDAETRQQLADLSRLVHRQTIALDNIQARLPANAPSERVEDRMSQGAAS